MKEKDEYSNWKKGHEFLLEKLSSQDAFTKTQCAEAFGWNPAKKTFGTYWSKQIKPLLVEVSAKTKTYRVSEVFRRFADWERFHTHVTQKRPVGAAYKGKTYPNVMMFEFFMPLTNEGYLRTSLDALFYKDTVKRRLRGYLEEIRKYYPEYSGTENEQLLEELCDWVAKRIGGYSIGHVAGRYRAGNLMTHEQAHQNFLKRYLVDESTAIVRFIIPLGEPSETAFTPKTSNSIDASTQECHFEAKRIRYFFGLLFIQQIVEAVNGEDEIWLLESGFASNLHIWNKS